MRAKEAAFVCLFCVIIFVVVSCHFVFSIHDFFSLPAQTLLACLQEASAVQLEAWEPLCDGMSFHFAFFAKSSSPRLKVEF